VEGSIGLAELSELGTRALATSAEAIAGVTELVQRVTGVDITVVSEVTADGSYVFRGLEKRPDVPVERDSAIPYEWSLCSRIHLGESPATVPDTRAVPALWRQWLRLKEGLGVDWDILAFCTRDVRLPNGKLYGTLCLHHLEPRPFSADEQALLEVLARLVGQELWRERAALELADALVALDAAEERRVELVDELRHELRAPLQVIDGYAEAMLDDVVAADDEHLTLVRREAGRAMRLLDDLAELARLEVRAAAGEPAAVAADETALEMRDRLAPLAEAAGVELVVDAGPALIRLPRKRLEQFFVNLVRNALRAVEHGGGSRVRIFVRRDGSVVELGVEDDGPGIAPDELPRVFERFYRGGSGRESGDGSGLGLTIARQIVETAGGEIAAEAGPAGGARIVARLPAAEDAPVEQAVAGGGEAAVQA
jgi:signal transduction histidine kinase